MKTEVVPIQQIHEPLFEEKAVSLFVKREDLNHPTISGNKFRKLKYNLAEAKRLGHKQLLTFGGAYSNHIYATAAAANAYGFESIGVIRGEETLPLNPTLAFAKSMGMEFIYLDRASYRLKNEEKVKNTLHNKFGDFYLIPEGGTNQLAIKGCKEIVKDLDQEYDYYCLAVGTGGTISGVISGLNGKRQVLGFTSLKGNFLEGEVGQLLLEYCDNRYSNWSINTDYHFGGYAKVKPELIDFMKDFEARHNILLDPVYTGKSMFGVYQLIHNGYFPEGSRILFIHTGGLQGRKGYNLK